MLRDLVQRAQTGDLVAFDALVERFQDAVFGAALAMVGRFDDAQDVAQEALICAWRDLPSLRDLDRFPGWLHRITQNRSRDLLRRPRRECEAPGLTETSALADPFREAARREARERVLAAVRSLSEPNRLATTLFYIDGYSIAEVAEFLEAPVGTVKRRLHDSRRQLERRLTDMVRETLEEGKPGPELRARVTEELAQRRARFLEMIGRPVDEAEEAEWARWWHERRMEDVRGNAAQYGIEPDEALPRMEVSYRKSETFRDDLKDVARRWGLPESVEVVSLRDLSRELLVSPLAIHRWEDEGLPSLRYYPWVLYDRQRVHAWLESPRSEPPLTMTEEEAPRPLLTILVALADGKTTDDEAATVYQKLMTPVLLGEPDPVWADTWEASREQERSVNAAQYGLPEPTGNWLGIPDERIPPQWEIRDATRRLGLSPIDLVRWRRQGMPCLRYSPLVRWDIDRVTAWLAEQGILPASCTPQELDRLELFVCHEVAEGRATPDEAYEALAGWVGVM